MNSKEELEKRFTNVKFYGPASIKENVEIGKGTGIGEYCVICSDVKIGCNCTIIYHVSIPRGTHIGNDVFIGPNTVLLNDKYPPTNVSLPPVIEDGAIIGGGVIIHPGVKVGKRAVIGGGSSIRHDVPPEVVLAGNPPKVLYDRDEYDRKRRELIDVFQR